MTAIEIAWGKRLEIKCAACWQTYQLDQYIGGVSSGCFVLIGIHLSGGLPPRGFRPRCEVTCCHEVFPLCSWKVLCFSNKIPKIHCNRVRKVPAQIALLCPARVVFARNKPLAHLRADAQRFMTIVYGRSKHRWPSFVRHKWSLHETNQQSINNATLFLICKWMITDNNNFTELLCELASVRSKLVGS